MGKLVVVIILTVTAVLFIGAAFIQWEYNFVIPKIAPGLTVETADTISADGVVVHGPVLLAPRVDYKTCVYYLAIGLLGGCVVSLFYGAVITAAGGLKI